MTRWLLTHGLVAAALAASALPTLGADSLWERRDPRHAHLFQDNRSRNVGDLVTVLITETTVANEREQRALDKSSNGTGSMQGSGQGTVGPSREFNFGLTSAFGRQFNGNAQMTSNRVFTDRLAATVVDVMPNGNLVIEGYRSRVVAGEERVLRITGVIRPADVGVGNLVASQSVANFRISYLGRGPESRTVNQNYLGRLMNAATPW